MSQKQRTLASLLLAMAVCGGLGALALKSARDEDTKKVVDDQAARLNSFDATQVNWVKLTARGETTELQKNGDLWAIVSPIHAPADPAVLEGVIGRLYDMKSKSKVEEAATDLAKYGLATPIADVEVKGPNLDVRVLFGDANGFNDSEYVKRASDSTVYLVVGSNAQLERRTFDLRDKRVLPFDTRAATAVSVRSPEGDYSLNRATSGWKVVTPVAEPADPAVVNQVLAAVSGLRAVGIPEEDPKDLSVYGLDHPTRLVTVSIGDKSSTYSFGAPAGQDTMALFARTDMTPTVYRLQPAALEALKQTPKTLEDKTAVSFDPQAVVGMTFATGNTTITIQRRRTPDAREGGVDAWTQMAPKTGPGKAWKINGIVRNLANLRAVSVEAAPADLSPFGLDKPRSTVTVQDNQGMVLAEIWVGAEKDGKVFVKTKDDPRVFSVDKVKLAALPEGPDDLWAGDLDGGE